VACKSWILVALSCFLPGRTKDLSAPGYEGSVEFGEEYMGHSEEKLEQMKEEAEDKPNF